MQYADQGKYIVVDLQEVKLIAIQTIEVEYNQYSILLLYIIFIPSLILEYSISSKYAGLAN